MNNDDDGNKTTAIDYEEYLGMDDISDISDNEDEKSETDTEINVITQPNINLWASVDKPLTEKITELEMKDISDISEVDEDIDDTRNGNDNSNDNCYCDSDDGDKKTTKCADVGIKIIDCMSAVMSSICVFFKKIVASLSKEQISVIIGAISVSILSCIDNNNGNKVKRSDSECSHDHYNNIDDSGENNSFEKENSLMPDIVCNAATTTDVDNDGTSLDGTSGEISTILINATAKALVDYVHDEIEDPSKK